MGLDSYSMDSGHSHLSLALNYRQVLMDFQQGAPYPPPPLHPMQEQQKAWRGGSCCPDCRDEMPGIQDTELCSREVTQRAILSQI